MPDRQDQNARFEAEMRMRSSVDPETQRRLEAAAGTGVPKVEDFTEYAKTLNEISLNMQSIARAMQVQQGYLNTTNDLQSKQNDLLKEANALQQEKVKAHAELDALNDKELRKRLKQLELTKEEDKIVRQIGKGNLTPDQNKTVQELRGAAAAQSALKKTGLDVEEAERLGGLGAREASVLRGGPERAKRMFGIPTSEGIGGATRALVGNPYVSAALAGLAINQGLQGMESQGAAGFLAGIPIIGGQLAGLAGQIPGLQAASAFGEATRLGQVTGEGYKAGISARFQAFRMGANPFDILSPGTASEIVSGVRGQGFRGGRARAYQGAVADIYKDLGLDVQTITSMAEIFVRNGRLDDFRASMENLDDIAKDTGVSVQAVAEQFKNLNDQLIRGGGMQNAPLAAGILGATNRTFPGLSAEQRGQVQQGTLSMMSTFSGLPQQVAETPYGAQLGLQMAKPILGRFSAMFRAMGPAHGPLSHAQQLMIGNLRASIPAFQGMDFNVVRDVLRNPGYLDRISHSAIRSQVNTAFGAAHESLERFHGQHLNDFVKGRMGDYSNMERGERGAYVDTLARKLGDTKMSPDQISKIINPLRRAAAGHGDWGDTLSEAGRRARKYSDSHVPKGHLNIRLDGNETRKLLSGKNVGKAVNLEAAFEGKAKSLGGQFLDAFP